MKFINLTPHTITLNDGTSFPPEGVARVSDTYTEFNTSGICKVKHGEIEGLPEPEANTTFIVSAMVLAAAKEKGREDVVAPATGHPECKRENGFIVCPWIRPLDNTTGAYNKVWETLSTDKIKEI